LPLHCTTSKVESILSFIHHFISFFSIKQTEKKEGFRTFSHQHQCYAHPAESVNQIITIIIILVSRFDMQQSWMGNGQNWRQIAQEPGPNGWSLTGRGHIT
jgi:hypothetical protein